MPLQDSAAAPKGWITRTVLGIVLATLFSDFSHEMVTAVLPYYLLTLGLGPSALGMIEGVADLLVSLAKLGGGVAGHRLPRKKPLVALGYQGNCRGRGDQRAQVQRDRQSHQVRGEDQPPHSPFSGRPIRACQRQHGQRK